MRSATALTRLRSSGGSAIVALLVGCLGCHEHHVRIAAAADSTATIAGVLGGTFAHGAPFYGSVVYLIPVTPVAEDWWVGLARPHFPLVDPQFGATWQYVRMTTCGPGGQFEFSGIRPGDYYLYARVFWTDVFGDSTVFHGGAWVGAAKVASRETVRIALRTPRALFNGGAPQSKFARAYPDDPSLPRFGENVYVWKLPQVAKRVPPTYPIAARSTGVDGTVLVQALVGRDGKVKGTIIQKSIPLLDAAADSAVRRYVFKPAMLGNKPVALWLAVPVRFTLQE